MIFLKLIVENVKIKLNKINDIIEQYQSNYISYYKELDLCREYWRDSYVGYFLEQIEEEKKDNQLFYEEICSLKNIYDLIIKSYQEYGNNIDFNLDTDILVKLDSYEESLKNIIKRYENLDSSFCGREHYMLMEEKELLNKNKDNIISLKDKYKLIIENILKCEKDIKLSLSKINVKKIKESDSEFHFSNDVSKISVKIDLIGDIVKKLIFFVNDNDVLFESLNEVINIFGYDTDNSDVLKEIEKDIIVKFRIINANKKNNILVLNNVMEKYRNMVY